MDRYQTAAANATSRLQGTGTLDIGSEQRQSLVGLLTVLFSGLDAERVRYCVLHSWRELPYDLPSDLDLAVHPADMARIPTVIRLLIAKGYQPIQMVQYAVRGFRLDVVWFQGSMMHSVGLDITCGYVEGGLTLQSGEMLVRDRRRNGLFWTADPRTEFAYLLARKTIKGCLSDVQRERLNQLVEEIGRVAAESIAAELFGDGWSVAVVDACTTGSIAGLFKALKRELWIRTLRRDPLNPIRLGLRNLARLARRVVRTTGLFVVILGPDGAGKSTVVGRLTQAFLPAFSQYRLFHWRPMVLKPQSESGRPVSNPHDEPARGPFPSVGALLFVFLDYLLGYLFVMRPLLTRSGLIIFDRYFQDILVDPVRYRYGGPMWLPKVLSRLVPPPDLVFLALDASEDVIFARKGELSRSELCRQRKGYRRLITDMENAEIVNSDGCVDETVEQACRFLVKQLATRFERKSGTWLAART